MHPAAIWLADDARELPDERHDRVPGALEALVDPGAVEPLEPGGGADRRGRRRRHDAELGLGLGQRRLDLEPGLPAVFLGIEGADAGVLDPRRGRQLVAHRCSSPKCRRR
jgi:hypothetical protein